MVARDLLAEVEEVDWERAIGEKAAVVEDDSLITY